MFRRYTFRQQYGGGLFGDNTVAETTSKIKKSYFFKDTFATLKRASDMLKAIYVPILLGEVEQEQRPSGNGDREAIVMEAGRCDGEDERAYTVYDPLLGKIF